jgi:ribosomal protein L13
MKTRTLKVQEISAGGLVDAEAGAGLASSDAQLLRGTSRVHPAPDTGDFVVVVNAEKVCPPQQGGSQGAFWHPLHGR